MFEVTTRTAAPYRSVCYITCQWSDGSQTRGSGVVVGLNDVLTAHHVVFDATRGGYATRITVTPGADTYPFMLTPYGSYNDVGVINGRTANWDPNGDQLLSAAESQYDIAVLGMRSEIGNVTGWLGLSAQSTDVQGMIIGYPGRGTGMMAENVYADASVWNGVFDINASLGPGASGGPLVRTDSSGSYVVGVLSSGDAALTHSTYAGLYSPGTWDWLMGVLESNNSVLPTAAVTAASANVYAGTSSDDQLVGATAGDTFIGSRGNDIFDGAGGVDTVTYTGGRSTYRLFNNGSSITVTDSLAGRDGIDSLRNMERIVFADMTVNLEVGAKSRAIAPGQLKTLQELYVAFFNRVPDADGLAYWIDQTRGGMQLGTVADAFYTAALQYPALTGYSASMTNSAFVNLVYKNVLGRTEGADAGGLAYWTGALDSGAQGRGALVSTILAVAHTFKGDATYGWVADLLDNKAAVAQKFAVDLGLNYNTPELSISKGMEIAAAITPTSTAAAIALIGVTDLLVL